MESVKKHLSGYKLYLFTFTALSLLTLLEVWLTQVRLSAAIVVGLILTIAVLQATILLMYNMHLKFQEKIFAVFIGVIFFLILVLIAFTMLDYIYR